MTDEEFDDALDGMSPSKRKKVLRLVSDEERVPRQKITHGTAAGRGFVILLAFIWSVPFTILGIALIVTVVLAPLGILLLVIGALPLHKAIKGWLPPLEQ